MAGPSSLSGAPVERLSAWPGFRLPDFAGAVRFARPLPVESLAFDTVHWDAPDLRLIRAGVELRHEGGSGEGTWTAVVPHPSTGSGPPTGESRRERAGSAAEVPVDLLAGLAGLLRGLEPRPVAHLQTARRRVPLVDGGERLVAEVTDDEVSVLEGGRVAARFREVSVIPAAGAPPGLAAQLVGVLRAAGGGDPEPVPPLVRALGPRALGPPDPAVPPLGDHPSAAAVVQVAVASSVQRLLAHDPVVRFDLGSFGVHQARVATRRLRSDLRTFEVLIDPHWAEALRGELAWLAGALGAVRDLDVLRQRLGKAAAAFDRADELEAKRLLRRLERSRRAALADLHAALATPRYFTLVDLLVDAARNPHLTDAASAPAREVLAGLVARPWRKLRKAARAADPDAPDEELHALRIRAKRARYAAEAAARAVPEAEALGAAIAELQGVLGDHHDAVVAEAWLREAVRAGSSRRQAMVAGLLVARQQAEAQACREDWPAVWAACDRKRLRGWLEQ